MPGAPDLLNKSAMASVSAPAPRTQIMPGQVNNQAPEPRKWNKIPSEPSAMEVVPPPQPPAPVPAVAPSTVPEAAPPTASSENAVEQDPLAEKYNETFITKAMKKASNNRGRTFRVTTSLVKLNWRSTRPFSIYKYDLKMVVRVGGVEKKSLLNKEETMKVMSNLRNDPKAREMMHNVFWSDFKSLFFSRESIPQTSFIVPLDERREVEVKITPTETITMTDMFRDADERFIQAFSNAIMFETTMDKNLVCQSSKVYCGSTFGLEKNLLEGRMGINYNFRVTEQGLMLAIDQCATAFIVAGPLLNTVKAVCGRNFDDNTGMVGKRSMTDVGAASGTDA